MHSVILIIHLIARETSIINVKNCEILLLNAAITYERVAVRTGVLQKF